ncbi:EpsG family protein [Modicisalibacter xianhensis]|uniref:EpsG family protein n=1 Tax=Modicisalibacter xianhensis TaxID=442341 RepID=UPI0015A51D1F|nr:EpsG family protein [Halomonas xianhensis]
MFISLLFYSIIVRISGFDVDMKVYTDVLKKDDLDGFYYLKEPVYWYFSHYLYKVINSETWTFVIIDSMVFFLTIKSVKNLKLPVYTALALLLFFPYLLGLQNVYRQLLATVLLVYFYSICYKNSSNGHKLFVFIIAGLTHNVALLFFPIYFLFKSKVSLIFFVLSGALILILLPYVVSYKSVSETGLELKWFYVSIIGIVCIISAFFYFTYDLLKINIFLCNLYLFVISLYASFILGGAQSERLSMICLVLLLCNLFVQIESRFKEKKTIAFITCVALFLPSFLFSSTFYFLTT